MQSAPQPSSSSSSATASTSAAPSSSWQERIAGGRITTAPPAFTKDGEYAIFLLVHIFSSIHIPMRIHSKCLLLPLVIVLDLIF